MALGLPNKRVIALDGDGALLMNLCGLPAIARRRPPNLLCVVFDNGVYETSGGTRTATADGVDLVGVARAVGIKNAFWAHSVEEFKRLFDDAMSRSELSFIGAKVEPGRTKVQPNYLAELENKYRFIRYVERSEGSSILGSWVPASWKGESEVRPGEGGSQPMPSGNAKGSAKAILSSMKEAGIDMIASLPDFNLLHLLDAVEQDPDLTHVPLCREEEGVGISAGGYLVGKKPALIMQNEGLMNSLNGMITTALQLEIPILLVIYYAGDIGDRGFARTGDFTIPVLDALRVRHYLVRKQEEVAWTFKHAQTLAEDSERPVAVLLTKDVLGVRS